VRALAVLVTCALAACEGAPRGADDAAVSADAAGLDAPVDAEVPDAVPVDVELPDAEIPDAQLPDAAPLAGFGTLSGTCNFLDHTAPGLVRGSITFDPGYTEAHLGELSAGGQEIIRDGNAGGSSLYSEVFSFEVLHRCENARLDFTETEVVYTTTDSKRTDLVVTIDDTSLGVSVTRAFVYPTTEPYTVELARALLERKLLDIQDSTLHVDPDQAWSRQFLHVLAYAPMHADSIEAAYAGLTDGVKGDTLVIVTVTEGDDEFIY
jgi:hypothetical protein